MRQREAGMSKMGRPITIPTEVRRAVFAWHDARLALGSAVSLARKLGVRTEVIYYLCTVESRKAKRKPLKCNCGECRDQKRAGRYCERNLQGASA